MSCLQGSIENQPLQLFQFLFCAGHVGRVHGLEEAKIQPFKISQSDFNLLVQSLAEFGSKEDPKTLQSLKLEEAWKGHSFTVWRC